MTVQSKDEWVNDVREVTEEDKKPTSTNQMPPTVSVRDELKNTCRLVASRGEGWSTLQTRWSSGSIVR